MRLVRPALPAAMLAALLSLAATLPAQLPQQPRIEHAQVTTASAAHGLGADLAEIERNPAPTWVGYDLPAPEGFHSGSDEGQVQYLEGGNRGWHNGSYSDATYDHFVLLLRVADGHIGKLNLATPGRTLDAGGLRFVWLTEVSVPDSLHVLASAARSPASSEEVRDQAIFFVSLHQSPETTPALVDLAGPANPLAIREKAAFWLANQRGRDGFLAIQRFARADPDPAFREKLTFDLTLCKDKPAATEELIRMAREDQSPQVRKQAQFWMANLGGEKVAGDLSASAEHDPDLAVRQSAVFAVSRLPNGQATDRLIHLAQTSHDPDVRRQAIFWLGQSTDPHAFDFLEHLLKN